MHRPPPSPARPWAPRRAAVLLAAALGLAACAGTGRAPAGLPAPAGPLVVIGGGDRPEAVLREIVALAGGPGARLVVVPHASGEPEAAGAALRADLLGAGARQVAVLLGPPGAPDALALLRGADGVVFAGGDQSRLARAFAGTDALAALRARHAAGAVVAGTSAGAAVMGPRMITGEERFPDASGDPFAALTAGSVETAEGFGLWPGVLVDQHAVRRRRLNRLVAAVLDAPALVGVAIDEATAVVVHGGRWRVVGAGAVVVLDARRAAVPALAPGDVSAGAGLALHVLRDGDRFEPARGAAARR